MLGRIEVEQGNIDEGIALFEAVWQRIADDPNTRPDDRADVAFRLAKALWDAGRERERERALELARRARAALIETGEVGAEELAEVEASLAKRELE